MFKHWLYRIIVILSSLTFSSFNVHAIELTQIPNSGTPPETPPPQDVIPPRPSPSPVPQIPPKPKPPPSLETPEQFSPPLPAEILERCPSTITVEDFNFRGNTVFTQEELTQVTEEFKQEPLSCAELLQAALAVTKFYIEKGYRTSGAITVLPKDIKPDQEVVVTIKVIEGKLEEEPEVIALGDGRLNNYVRSRLGVELEEPLNVNQLQEALQLLQLDPLIESIAAKLARGSDTGKSILEVQYSEAPTFNPQVSLNNGRSPSVGSFERGVVLRQANLLGLGDAISLGYTNSDGSDRLDLSYELPLNSSNGTLRFTYLQSENDVIEPPFNDLDIESESRYYELSLRQPIIRSIKGRTFQELALGLTGFWRESESFLFDEPFRFSLGADDNGSTRIFALRFFQDWTRQNPREVIALRSEFSLGLDAFNSTVNEQISGVEEIADSRFFAWRGQAQWLRLLAENSLLLVRVNAQLAEALLPSEQFAIGGLGSVRGYRQDQIITDNGLFASAEVRLPILRIFEGEGMLQLIPFVDYGIGWNSSDRTNPDPNNLASVGIGLQWQQGNNFNARLDWGIPLVDVDLRDRTWQENGILFTVQWNPSF
ncbi:MAG: ShlB/FhaC/HecB family hemolysin secretion/activation protein [Symploca sp. SIO2E9]|nr:ShlB/FhaC/HecB family hemolysin secretion/activation protein [Symploca sp. SIO2E9]